MATSIITPRAKIDDNGLSEWLKHLLSPGGMYAFSQFLIGWQICSSLYESTLKYILSDYGILAIELGLIKVHDLYGKTFCETILSQHNDERLYCKEITHDDLLIKPTITQVYY